MQYVVPILVILHVLPGAFWLGATGVLARLGAYGAGLNSGRHRPNSVPSRFWAGWHCGLRNSAFVGEPDQLLVLALSQLLWLRLCSEDRLAKC